MPIRSWMPLRILLLALAPLPAAAAAAAQTVSIDEGTFRLLAAGREVGTETFSIRQSGTGAGAVVIAQGTVALDTAGVAEHVRASLRLEGPALRPAAYDVAVRGSDQQRIAGRLVGGRFSAKIQSPAGEQMREYLASDGAVLLDDGVAHHYYFLARRYDGGVPRIPVIIPRQSRQVSAEIAERGTEEVEVGGRRVSARRLVVTPAGAGERHVWVDARGRVLRLEIPAQRFAAVRTSPPR